MAVAFCQVLYLKARLKPQPVAHFRRHHSRGRLPALPARLEVPDIYKRSSLVRRGITIVIVLLILVVPGFHFHFILSICMVSHSSITDLCFTTLNATKKEGKRGRQRDREGQRGRETWNERKINKKIYKDKEKVIEREMKERRRMKKREREK
jgi:hypothetical protein